MESIAYLEIFFTVSSKISMSATQIRSLICDIIGDIPVEDPRWAKHRATLQSTAAHSPNSMVQTHYELGTKPQRERILQQYLEIEFHIPARSILNRQLQSVNQSDYMTSPFVTGMGEGSESDSDTVTEEDPSSSDDEPAVKPRERRPSISLPSFQSSSSSSSSSSSAKTVVPLPSLLSNDPNVYSELNDLLTRTTTGNNTPMDNDFDDLNDLGYQETPQDDYGDIQFDSFDEKEPLAAEESPTYLSKPAKVVPSIISSDSESSGAEEFRRLKRQMLELKRKRKARIKEKGISQSEKNGDMSDMKTSYKRKHKSTKKHSKRSKKQHKKQKTVRTKCQNKINGKRCFSKSSIQNFNEEGQIFCNDCKKAYGFSGGWSKKRYNEYMDKTKKKEQKENAVVPDSNADSQSDDEQTDT